MKTNKNNSRDRRVLLGLAVILFCTDRALKAIVTSFSGDGFFYFYPNYSFGFNLGISQPIGLGMMVAVWLFLLFKIIKKRTIQAPYLAWFVLFLGASSNLYDRFVFNYVIDYFCLGKTYFNLADIIVFFGVFLLIRDGGKYRIKNKK